MAGELPVMLNLRDRRVVIVGGGAVAARKAVALLAAGARPVRIVAPTFCDCLPDGLERVSARFEPAHLNGAWLALACTDDSVVNDDVVRAARQRGMLVWRADFSDAEPGDFSMMASHAVGPIVLACSGGGTPGVARRALRQAAQALDPALVELAGVLQSLRSRWRREPTLDAPTRRRLFRWLSSDEAVTIFREGGSPLLMQRAAEQFPTLPPIDASP
jgi:uroporphyrin-III C-methyltransferase/precorrin-2 dehydrogenase/sirohydrochlorin ferrochelatase